MRSLLPLVVLLSACPPSPTPAPPLVLETTADGAFTVSRAGTGLSALRASATLSGVELALTAPTRTDSPHDDALGHAQQTVFEQVEGDTRLLLTLNAYPDFVTGRLSVFCEGSCPGA